MAAEILKCAYVLYWNLRRKHIFFYLKLEYTIDFEIVKFFFHHYYLRVLTEAPKLKVRLAIFPKRPLDVHLEV